MDLSTKDTVQGPKICFLIVLIHFKPPKEDNLSTKETTAEFIVSPMCPLFGGSTVQDLTVDIVAICCSNLYNFDVYDLP